MIAARQFRLGERQKKGGVGEPTERDIQNIDDFTGKISEAIDLLRKEINAINEGNLNIVSDLFEDKSNILKWLELKMPLVEPFIRKDAALARKLPDRLDEFKSAVEENSSLLSRMATAAGTVAREIEKATQRHSLNGLYGKSGQKISDPNAPKMTVDREF